MHSRPDGDSQCNAKCIAGGGNGGTQLLDRRGVVWTTAPLLNVDSDIPYVKGPCLTGERPKGPRGMLGPRPRRASGGGCRRRARATTAAPNLDHNHGTIGVEFACGPRGCGRRLLAVAGDDDDAVDGTRLHPGDRAPWVSGDG